VKLEHQIIKKGMRLPKREWNFRYKWRTSWYWSISISNSWYSALCFCMFVCPLVFSTTS